VKPILRWTGSKAAFVWTIAAHAPSVPGHYYEPFLGGAALFLALTPPRARLSDADPDLIGLYRALVDNCDNVIAGMAAHVSRHCPAYYYDLRNAFNKHTVSPDCRPHVFLYLNRAGFQGVHRRSASGAYNVPYGNKAKRGLFKPEALRRASSLFASADLACHDYKAATIRAGAGDIVYFDPPYHGAENLYISRGFGDTEHRQLAEWSAALASRGARVIISNSDTPFIRALYHDFKIQTVVSRRSVGPNRAAGTELIITLPERKFSS